MQERIENRMVVDSEWEHAGKPVNQCQICSSNIYSGDDFYNFNGDIVCDSCGWEYVRENFRQTAEQEKEYGKRKNDHYHSRVQAVVRK